MKKILMISLLFSLTVGFVACDDNKDEYLSDYSTIVYFRNSGEIPLTLYKTGEDTEYQLTVNKSGSDLASVTDVEVAVLDLQCTKRDFLCQAAGELLPTCR